MRRTTREKVWEVKQQCQGLCSPTANCNAQCGWRRSLANPKTVTSLECVLSLLLLAVFSCSQRQLITRLLCVHRPSSKSVSLHQGILQERRYRSVRSSDNTARHRSLMRKAKMMGTIVIAQTVGDRFRENRLFDIP